MWQQEDSSFSSSSAHQRASLMLGEDAFFALSQEENGDRSSPVQEVPRIPQNSKRLLVFLQPDLAQGGVPGPI